MRSASPGPTQNPSSEGTDWTSTVRPVTDLLTCPVNSPFEPAACARGNSDIPSAVSVPASAEDGSAGPDGGAWAEERSEAPGSAAPPAPAPGAGSPPPHWVRPNSNSASATSASSSHNHHRVPPRRVGPAGL